MMPVTEILPAFFLLLLPPALAIAAGLLMFFLGRSWVRRRCGGAGKKDV